MLNILEGYPLREYGFGSARAVHLQIEAMRQAYVDRNFLLGDPSFMRKNPLEQLLDNDTRQRFGRASIRTCGCFRCAFAGHR